jgi:competence protein ComEC
VAPCLGTGIGLYFALPDEPSAWAGPAAVVLLSGLFVAAGRRGSLWAVPVVAVLAAACGLTLAQTHARGAAAPILDRPLGPVEVAGRVVALDPHDGRWRVVLSDLEVARLAPERTPARLRLVLYDAGPTAVGGRIAVPARLLPPPPPAAPGAFDFPRRAWFERLGAVGFAVGVPRAVAAPPPGPWRALADWGERLRGAVGERLRTGVGGAAGAVAAALATGQRGAVPATVIEAYRQSGLAHLLAISGLHMGLAAGLVFVVLRGLLALIPPIALRRDIKKVTAVCAIAAMAVYLALSGGTVPAQRAFIMGGVVFGAILVDRAAITLRVLAVAAVVVLAWQPQALVGASFQMSFAAVVALVAAYESLAPRLAAWRGRAAGPGGAALRGIGAHVFGILASTVVAGLATAPFAAFHFHRLALFGVVANGLAMPVMAFWVMPWLAVALILMPFGGDGLAHAPLRLGLDAVDGVAGMVAGWPDAVLAVPPMPVPVLVAATFGGLWLCLNRQRWRWIGGGATALALVLPWSRPVPLLVISGDGTVAAVRSGDGLVLSPGRGDRFTRDLWRELWGAGEGIWTAAGLEKTASATAPAAVRLTCDALGCLYDPGDGGRPLALVHHPAALPEDCATARAVIATVALRRAACPAGLVVSRWDLWRDGTHAIYATADGLRVETVAGARGRRPWTAGASRQ